MRATSYLFGLLTGYLVHYIKEKKYLNPFVLRKRLKILNLSFVWNIKNQVLTNGAVDLMGSRDCHRDCINVFDSCIFRYGLLTNDSFAVCRFASTGLELCNQLDTIGLRSGLCRPTEEYIIIKSFSAAKPPNVLCIFVQRFS